MFYDWIRQHPASMGGIPPANTKEVHCDLSGAAVQKLEAITCKALGALHAALPLFLYKIML